MIIAFLFILFIFFMVRNSHKESKKYPISQPNIMIGNNGYESHLDFLEMHGFISEEEREEDRKALQHYKDHPDQYVTLTMEELGKRLKCDN